MKVKDCIEAAAGYLGIENIEEKLQGSEGNAFLQIARCIVSEIVSDYYPLRVSEELESESGELFFRDFEKDPIDIYFVRKEGISVPFRTFFDRIETASGRVQVEYSFLPYIEGIDSDLPFSERVSARVVGYGIAAEYCIINGMDEAVIYDKRYRDALRRAAIVKGEKRLAARNWI
jgi:hypothetical protein